MLAGKIPSEEQRSNLMTGFRLDACYEIHIRTYLLVLYWGR